MGRIVFASFFLSQGGKDQANGWDASRLKVPYRLSQLIRDWANCTLKLERCCQTRALLPDKGTVAELEQYSYVKAPTCHLVCNQKGHRARPHQPIHKAHVRHCADLLLKVVQRCSNKKRGKVAAL